MKYFRKHELIATALLLSLMISAVFNQVVFGDRTLMFSARTMASVMPYGSYTPSTPVKVERPTRSPDSAAPAWQTDPWVLLLHNQVFKEHVVPLWNPYSGLGMPALANMQSQPFFVPFWIPCIFPAPFAVDLFDLSRVLIAGVFCYMFLRLFLVRAASLIGAIAFMLTGYIVLFLNMPEISVAVSAPFVFYAFERVIRRTTPRTIALAALASCVNLLGGMPESTALVMVFAGIYFIVRVLALRRTALTKLKTVGGLAAGCALGLCLAAPQVLPFLEYMRQSFNVHDPSLGVPISGTVTDGSVWWPQIMGYILPYDIGGIMYLAQEPLPAPVRAYVGTITTLLAFIAVSVLVRRLGGKHPREKMILHLVSFFSCASLFFVLKRFGCPLVNWIGSLPLMEMILFPKYDEPLLGLSMAILAASGMHLVLRKQVKFVDLIASVVAVALPFGIWKFQEHPAHFLSRRHWVAYHYNLFVFLFFLIASSGLIAGYMLAVRSKVTQMKQQGFKRVFAKLVPPIFTAFLLLELTVLAIFPVFYLTKQLPFKQCNPYSGAPFISFLQGKSNSLERIMANDAFLFPCWSAAYSLYDIRALDAMYVGRFLPFVRNFLYGDPRIPRDKVDPTIPNMNDLNATTRFHGIEEGMQYPTELKPNSLLYKMFVLCSTRYVITEAFSQRLTPEMKEIIKQNTGRKKDFFGPRDNFFQMDGKRLNVVYQHPEGKNLDENKIVFKTTVPPERPVLTFRVGVNYRKPEPSDGATAYVRLLEEGQADKLLFTKALDAAHGSEFPLTQLDLSAHAGKPITLQFAVDAGPTKIPFYDWIGWADLRFVDRVGDTSTYWSGTNSCGFKRIYSGECAIFENPKILPRASVFCDIKLVSKGDDALKLMRSSDFDVLSEVVVEDENISATERQQVKDLATSPENSQQNQALAQNITRYSAHEIDIDVDSAGGLLMLNDTMYPGWKAYVDGKPVSVHYSDFLFRGIFVAPGKHAVQFRYEPISFLLGVALFVVSAITLAILWTRRKARTITGSQRVHVQSGCLSAEP